MASFCGSPSAHNLTPVSRRRSGTRRGLLALITHMLKWMTLMHAHSRRGKKANLITPVGARLKAKTQSLELSLHSTKRTCSLRGTEMEEENKPSKP